MPNRSDLNLPEISSTASKSILASFIAEQKKMVLSVLPGNNYRLVSSAVGVTMSLYMLEDVSAQGDEAISE